MDHSLEFTAANIHDSQLVDNLVRIKDYDKSRTSIFDLKPALAVQKNPLPWNRKNRQRLIVMMGLSNLIQSIGYSVSEIYENNHGIAS